MNIMFSRFIYFVYLQRIIEENMQKILILEFVIAPVFVL